MKIAWFDKDPTFSYMRRWAGARTWCRIQGFGALKGWPILNQLFYYLDMLRQHKLKLIKPTKVDYKCSCSLLFFYYSNSLSKH